MAAIIGIDPGQTGALALVGTDRRNLIEVCDMPMTDEVSAHGVADLLQRWKANYDVAFAVVEKVASMPRQGVASTFKFGMGFGILKGALAAVGISARYYTPVVWTKKMGVGPDKDAHRQRCIEMWPDQYELFKLKKHDGRADASLLAVYGMQVEPLA